MIRHFNSRLGDKLALWLSTMGCFYLIFALVVVPLFFQHPSDLVGWVQYIVQSLFQGVALPVLGYVARIAGEKQEKVLNSTHDAVLKELKLLKKQMADAAEERKALRDLTLELHEYVTFNASSSPELAETIAKELFHRARLQQEKTSHRLGVGK